MNPFIEVFAAFLKLGFTAFGGPAAHIGMFRDEFVRRRKWLGDEAFLDLLAAANLIPGPNSTEMAMHIGFVRAGGLGLVAGGLGFILPAMFIVLALAWFYVRYGSAPQAAWILYGIKPVLIAVILQALWELGRKALKDRQSAGIGLACLLLYFLGVNEILLLFAGGLTMMLLRNGIRPRGTPAALLFPLHYCDMISLFNTALSTPMLAPVAFTLSTLFLTFLKIGSILYGSGYVLVAFLRADFVERLGWLTESQLMDAIAIGQVTPGPLFTSATFIGYVLGGVPAALVATLGIFLPSFIFVAFSNPIIPKLRQSRRAGSLLDGVVVASLALMAAVTFQLGRASLTDIPTVLIFLLSTFLLMRFKVNSTWLVPGGAIAGSLVTLLN